MKVKVTGESKIRRNIMYMDNICVPTGVRGSGFVT
jgi:hypothetical protein